MNKEQEKEFNNTFLIHNNDKLGTLIHKKSNGFCERVYDKDIKTFINKLLKEERERILKWAENYMQKTTEFYGTDKHNISIEDLKEFLNK